MKTFLNFSNGKSPNDKFSLVPNFSSTEYGLDRGGEYLRKARYINRVAS